MIRFLLALLVCCSAVLCTAQTPPSLDDTNWKLVFQDDFNDSLSYTGPSRNWRTNPAHGYDYMTNFVRWAYYPKQEKVPCDNTSINHVMGDGYVNLMVRKEPGAYEHWTYPNGQLKVVCEEYQYTGALLLSEADYLYGYFEINCNVPFQGKYIWPAFWLYDGGNETYREIDIFEFSNPKPNQFQTNIHIAEALDCGETGRKKKSKTNLDLGKSNDYHDRTTLPFDVSKGFHTYAVEWHPEYVAFYADDVLYRRIEKHSPNMSMKILINNAVAPWHAKNYSDDMFPNSMMVDRVRVWQRTNLSTPSELFVSSTANQELNIDSKYYSTGTLDYNGDGNKEVIALSKDESGAASLRALSVANKDMKNTASSTTIPRKGLERNLLACDTDGNGSQELLTATSKRFGKGAEVTMWRNMKGDWKQATWSDVGSRRIKAPAMVQKSTTQKGDELLLFSCKGKDLLVSKMKLANGDWTETKTQLKGEKKAVKKPMHQGDFNGDGRGDLLLLKDGKSEADLVLYLGNATGGFDKAAGAGKIKSRNVDMQHLVFDQDGDGKDDLIIAGKDHNTGKAYVVCMLSNGLGSWKTTTYFVDADSEILAFDAIAGDFNGDGKGDLLYRSQDLHECGLNISLFSSDGKGNWSYSYQVEPDKEWVQALSPVAADVNNDKKTDLVFFVPKANYIKTLLAK